MLMLLIAAGSAPRSLNPKLSAHVRRSSRGGNKRPQAKQNPSTTQFWTLSPSITLRRQSALSNEKKVMELGSKEVLEQ
jgi:hypothetical protein